MKIIDNKSNQTGVALISSMLMLLILTLIGVSAMMFSTMEEKMSSNQRERSLAFQAAESALRAGEEAMVGLMTANPIPTFGCTDANTCPSLVSVTDPSVWGEGSNATSYTGDLSNSSLTVLANSPQYLIEVMNNGKPVESCKVSGLSTGPCQASYYCYYRITARGVGGTSSAVVILQSSYIYPPATNNTCHAS